MQKGRTAEDYGNRKELIDLTEFNRRPPNVATPTPVDTSRRKEHPARRLSTTSRKTCMLTTNQMNEFHAITFNWQTEIIAQLTAHTVAHIHTCAMVVKFNFV